MGNRSVAYENLGAAAVSVAVFDGEGVSEKGECLLKFELWSGGSFCDIRSYCRAADLERIGLALLKAAADVRERDGD